jgi:opacity protein-like surface antigen
VKENAVHALTRLFPVAGLTLLAVLLSAQPARAQLFVNPFIGVPFGGDTIDQQPTYGASLGVLGNVLGFEVEVGYTPDFFDPAGAFDVDSNLTTLMGNLLFALAPGRVRPYVTAGAGLMRAHVRDVGGFFDDVNENDFGVNAGFGVFGFFTPNVGLRGDVRYFRSLADDDNVLGIDLGAFDFWRATVGLTLRF